MPVYKYNIQHNLLLESWAPQGPASVLLKVFGRLGWTFSSDALVVRADGGGTFDLWSVDQTLLCRMLTQDLWLALCNQVGRRRKHMSHLVGSSLDLCRLRRFVLAQDSADQTLLAGILAGGFRWQKQQRSQGEGLRTCPFFDMDGVGPEHIWWSREATSAVREKHPDLVARAGLFSGPLRA